jgi:hypothetical protein
VHEAKPVRWKDIEYFDVAWKDRIGLMAGFIPQGAAVLDLGCGKEWLRELVPDERYQGVDYTPRGPTTIVCDFNCHEFPPLRKDVCFVSGCLEYIEDPAWFIGRIAATCERCIVSYCLLDTHPDIKARCGVGWVNHLNLAAIRCEFERQGFMLAHQTSTPTRNAVLVFDRASSSAADGLRPGSDGLDPYAFMRRTFCTAPASGRALLARHADAAAGRPLAADAGNWQEVGELWKDYFLGEGARAWLAGRQQGAIECFARAAQACPGAEDAHLAHLHAWTEFNRGAVIEFVRRYSGAGLIVAHVSCRARLEQARGSAATFTDESDWMRNLLVVGDAARQADSFEFDPDSGLLVVPAGDAYEDLPRKVQKLFQFLGDSGVSSAVLKVDDNVLCAEPRSLRPLAESAGPDAYAGAVVVPPTPFLATRCWHLGKCADPGVSGRPDSLLQLASFVPGKYYWLGHRTVGALAKAAVLHERHFETEVYEDRAIGAVLQHYAFRAEALDLFAAGALAPATTPPRA